MTEYTTPTDDASSLLNSPESPTYNSSEVEDPTLVPPKPFILDDKKRCSRSNMLGIFCLILCLITWETMGELLQDVNLEYPKPATLTFIVHSWYAVLLLPWVIIRRNTLRAAVNKNWMMIKLALALFPLMWLAAYLWYVSLRSTLVSANNAIYQSQCVFVYIVSMFVLGEKFDLHKVGVLALCVVGVALVVFAADNSTDNASNTTLVPATAPSSSSHAGPMKIKQTLWGYTALLLGVVAFAFYEVIFKKYEQQEEQRKRLEIKAAGPIGSVGMVSHSHQEDVLEASVVFLGFCGLVNIGLGWPFVVAFDVIGLEPFLLPSAKLTQQIMLNGFIDTIFNFAFIWGVALTSPVFMSTGTILIIPVGIVVDGVLGKGTMNFWQLCGVGLIVCGFLGLNWVSSMKKKGGGAEVEGNQVVDNSNTDTGSASSSSIRVPQRVSNADDMW